MTIIWCIAPEILSATDRIFCHSGLFFAPLPPMDPENQNFEKLKKTPEDINILHMCTINDNHMMYDSWDIECDGQIFLSFWTTFCPFTPIKTQKIKICKNWKKHLKILSFMYDVWLVVCIVPEIWSKTDRFFCYFGPFFCTFILLTTWKIKILKKWKNCLETLSFYTSVP